MKLRSMNKIHEMPWITSNSWIKFMNQSSCLEEFEHLFFSNVEPGTVDIFLSISRSFIMKSQFILNFVNKKNYEFREGHCKEMNFLVSDLLYIIRNYNNETQVNNQYSWHNLKVSKYFTWYYTKKGIVSTSFNSIFFDFSVVSENSVLL